MTIKHNKLRNTGILFELLVRQMTTDTLNDKKSKAVDILKKYYNNSDLSKEYRIYNSVASAKGLTEAKANFLINAAVEAHKKLNKKLLRNEKYNLISEIKSSYNINEFFKSKVDNYKILASLYMLFEMDGSNEPDPTKIASYKYTILESVLAKSKEDTRDDAVKQIESADRGTKALVYKLAVKSFNEKYDAFNDRQKNILREYISNISTSQKLKDFMNEEMSEAKKQLKKRIKGLTDEVRKVKLNEVLTFISPIPENKQVTEKDVENLLYYHEIIKELDAIDKKK